MSRPMKQQLMERITMRLVAETQEAQSPSSKQLAIATTELIDHVRHLRAAFSAPDLKADHPLIPKSGRR